MERHTLTLEAEPSAFQRRNALAPRIEARCSCGWRTTALFEDTARRAHAEHVRTAAAQPDK